MTTGGDGALRIGTAEREAAAAALNTHLEAGRLGVEEYADRSAVAANAVTAAELTALFTDLPEPHPRLPGSGGSAPAVRPQAAVQQRGFGGSWGTRIAAASPIVALVLFFVLNAAGVSMAWLAFLLIPLVGALGFSKDRQEARELEREQRRALPEERRDG
ncbi:DUF1707 domain-containing protein [Pseudonocardia sp. RS11V-5]|uniref:DUF1707 domain-containing protein n=1 Tax=Pseudonocardia terrae TaxID=2905831 RepID=UPI001E5008B5|nr:DUF1707 domain-containing protein [Pseudonocardia terrae]MCE3550224.1 DUF1707 domain-containing protein [Pseudonocardia terrae]